MCGQPGQGRKTWGECVKDDMGWSLIAQYSVSGIYGESSCMGQTSNPSLPWNRWTF